MRQFSLKWFTVPTDTMNYSNTEKKIKVGPPDNAAQTILMSVYQSICDQTELTLF